MESRFAQAGDLRMHYLRHGEGEPVVLIHGFPQTSHAWRRMMPLLGDRFTLHAIDTRGHGLTDKPDAPAGYTRESLARDVVAFIDAMGWEAVNVVAHDWGGIIASKLALDFGDRVKRLALLDTITTGWPRFVEYYYWFMSPGRADRFFRDEERSFIETMYLGKSEAPCPPPPGSPWNIPRELIAAQTWATPEDIEHYVTAQAAAAAHDVDLHYYRNLRFHRVIADGAAPHGERYEPVSHEVMGRLWETGEAGREYLDYAVADRHKTYAGPVLWMYNQHLLTASGSSAAERGPEGDPAWDNFRRNFPKLASSSVAAGHFFPEERPDVVAAALRAFLSSPIT
jgi:pimeloyl-ACP methyl ester carboxylesterase